MQTIEIKGNKIIVISDLHADLNMLNELIIYIEKEGIDKVLNLGDFISHGPNPCEVFDKIIKDTRFINIKGYDEESLFNQEKKKQGIGMGEWLVNKLGKSRMNKLKAMPSLLSVKIKDKLVLMTHLNGLARLKQQIAHLGNKAIKEHYDFVCLGGEHIQELKQTNKLMLNTILIKPGALLSDKEKIGHFAIINFKYIKPEVTFKHIQKVVGKDEELEDLIEINKKVQDEILKDTLLYIYTNKKGFADDTVIPDFVIERILKIGLKHSKYISIGCWEHEKNIIRELLFYLKCRNIRKSNKTGQQWYIGEITPELSRFVLEKRNTESGHMKWFEISFLDNKSAEHSKYGIYHYGKECILSETNTRELKEIENILDESKINYQVITK